MEVQAISWLQILQVGGFAGVISALISGGVKELFDSKERKRKARYLALRLSLILEGYYHACTDRIYSIDNYHGSGDIVGCNDVGLPEIADYPDDPAAWVYLDQKIADEILSLPASIRAIDEGISFNVNIDSDPDGPSPDLTLKPLYEMAFRSITLARRVRAKHRLSETNRTEESESRLHEKQVRFLEELRVNEEKNRTSLSAF